MLSGRAEVHRVTGNDSSDPAKDQPANVEPMFQDRWLFGISPIGPGVVMRPRA